MLSVGVLFIEMVHGFNSPPKNVIHIFIRCGTASFHSVCVTLRKRHTPTDYNAMPSPDGRKREIVTWFCQLTVIWQILSGLTSSLSSFWQWISLHRLIRHAAAAISTTTISVWAVCKPWKSFQGKGNVFKFGAGNDNAISVWQITNIRILCKVFIWLDLFRSWWATAV